MRVRNVALASTLLATVHVAGTGGITATSVGPVAIGIATASEATVLQSDGRVLRLATDQGTLQELYRVPTAFQGMDLAVGAPNQGPQFCVSINAKASRGGSFLLQVMPDQREVWTFLAHVGLFVGVATDPDRNVAYVTEATQNVIRRVAMGQERAAITEMAALPLANAIGPIAIDVVRQRLFVADIDGSALFVIDIANGNVRRVVLGTPSTIRAITWSPALARVYIADSGRESVWAVDPEGQGGVERVFKDKRFRDPSGLAVSPDGSLWMVDQLARSAFQLDVKARTIQRHWPWGKILRPAAK